MRWYLHWHNTRSTACCTCAAIVTHLNHSGTTPELYWCYTSGSTLVLRQYNTGAEALDVNGAALA